VIYDKALVTVTTTSEDYGSGVVVFEDERHSWVLTCAHVVSKGRVIVKDRSGKSYRGTVKKVNAKNDLCLIKLSTRIYAKLELAKNEPQLFDEVFVCGTPPGYRIASKATFCGSDKDCGGDYCITGGVTMPGCSGGAVINDDGDLVGLITTVAKDGNLPVWGICWAVSLEKLHSFLKKMPK